MNPALSRRHLVLGAAAAALPLAGCDEIAESASVRRILETAERLTLGAQRLLLAGQPLAREFTVADISPSFRANGTTRPDGESYGDMEANGFRTWRLTIDGLVRQKLVLSLDELKRLPSRTQVTRHDCVEGWSAIGQWTGTPLGLLLQVAGLLPQARYLVFHCMDQYEKASDGSGQYYERIDLVDAFHPQTILAYSLNGRELPVANGAPVRLRVERQLGYKQAKYIERIEAVESFAQLGRGRGGYWEDRGYEWYAGI